MRIAILGGRFDPPHIGHLLIAQTVKKHLNIEQVWLLPSPSHDKTNTATKHRLAMTQLLEDDIVKASDRAITHTSGHYPLETMYDLTKEYPQHSFYWVSGTDQINEYPLWHQWQTFLQTQKIILYTQGEPKETVEQQIKQLIGWDHLPNTIFLLAPQGMNIHISSSAIKEKIKRSESIRGLVPKKVEIYIQEHKLYHQ